MFLMNLQKHLVYGALIEAEILTSPSPMYLLILAKFGHWHSAHRCVHTSQVVLKCVYVSQEPQKIFGALALIETEILTPPSPMYLLKLAKCLGSSTLPMGVSTPPKWSRNVSMCLRNLHKCGALGPNRSCNIDHPHVFA